MIENLCYIEIPLLEKQRKRRPLAVSIARRGKTRSANWGTEFQGTGEREWLINCFLQEVV